VFPTTGRTASLWFCARRSDGERSPRFRAGSAFAPGLMVEAGMRPQLPSFWDSIVPRACVEREQPPSQCEQKQSKRGSLRFGFGDWLRA
jgi:hypothetical protein